MTCPVCNAQNSAMNARCLECGTILIPEAVVRSEDVRRTVHDFDKRMSLGYGGLAGFVVGFGSRFAFSQDENEVKSWLVVGVITGAVFGRLLA